MNLIVAVDQNWGIGKKGGLLVHLPGDLKFFKEKTLGKVVVMGRTTLESLPGQRPLPGRTNIVLSRNADYQKEGCVVIHSKEELEELREKYGEDEVFIIGGGTLYKEFLDLCEKLYVTRIFSTFGADTFFPNLDETKEFEITWESDVQLEKGVSYVWLEYTRCK